MGIFMAEIKLIEIEKYFGKNYVIRKLNLDIKDGEFLVLLGPSGCGKTTTLRAIAGLEEIDAGDILIDGQVWRKLTAVSQHFRARTYGRQVRLDKNFTFPGWRQRVLQQFNLIRVFENYGYAVHALLPVRAGPDDQVIA